ncbi:glycine cleavage system protein H [Syntrophus aciditrophicus]|uniref:Glycine cleavage system H protein n=1 Tax=Syntrophus aciditrophicus (strain SB) TaxID=56780 RepID=Q2LWS6_SYNAS|nr:glycine cleavage system protein GcvH [Syntrophus aciditrophicus]ABC78536.1 glycine cleavage system H protein [Syntrophus aciditrophicus SB]
MKIFPDDLLYSREHIWVAVDGNMATLGITDYAQEKLGDVDEVDLPKVDSFVERDEPFGTLESANDVFELVSPLSGEIVNVNEDIMEDVTILNSDPYDAGWIVVIEMKDPEELDDLLEIQGYQDYIAEEE